MKKITLLFCMLASSAISMGQAKIFEPILISDNTAFGLTISPNGKELLYVNSFGGRDTLQLFQSKKIKGLWQIPEPAFFSDARLKQIDPFISPDGNTILFNSRTSEQKNFDVYAIYKANKKWSAPVLLPAAINTAASEFYATLSNKKNIYFTRRVTSNDLYVSYFVNNQYQEAIPLDSTINSSENESNPYISPDEDYLIFFSDRKGGHGDTDLYISFRNNLQWSYPINLGPKINSDLSEFCPFVDANNHMFYFSRTQVVDGRRVENMYEIKLKELGLKELKLKARYKQ